MSPAPATSQLVPGTTPDSGAFQPGTLDLEVTPPFNASSRQYADSGGSRGVACGAGAALAVDGVSQHPGGDALERSARQHRYIEHRQAQRPRSSLLHVEPSASSTAPARAHTRGSFGRRQLMFSGRDDVAGRPEFREDYEGQLLGSEGVGVGYGDPTGATSAEIQHRGEWMVPGDGAIGGAAGEASLPVDLDHFREERVCGSFMIQQVVTMTIVAQNRITCLTNM